MLDLASRCKTIYNDRTNPDCELVFELTLGLLELSAAMQPLKPLTAVFRMEGNEPGELNVQLGSFPTKERLAAIPRSLTTRRSWDGLYRTMRFQANGLWQGIVFNLAFLPGFDYSRLSLLRQAISPRYRWVATGIEHGDGRVAFEFFEGDDSDFVTTHPSLDHNAIASVPGVKDLAFDGMVITFGTQAGYNEEEVLHEVTEVASVMLPMKY